MIYWGDGLMPCTENFHPLLLEEMAKHLEEMEVISDDDDDFTAFVYNNCEIKMTSSTGFSRGFDTFFTFKIVKVDYYSDDVSADV